MAPSRHDWKIVDWDVKPQHNQPNPKFGLGLPIFHWGGVPDSYLQNPSESPGQPLSHGYIHV